jgi:Tol biopolymer transport system component
VVASPAFRGADRLVRFLNFVIEETLDGRGDRLKESVIGVEVFDRSAGYDPKIDPIVRVQARRLRTKLEAHYASSPPPSDLRILLPKGGYTPEFFRAELIPPDEQPLLKPRISRPAHGLKRRSEKLAVVSILLLAAAAGPAILLRHRSIVKPRGSRLFTAYPGYQDTPAFSPDGKTIAFSWGGPDNANISIYLQRLDADAPTRLTTPASRDVRPVWLPDGQHIGFLRGDGPDRFLVMVVLVLGGGERQVATLFGDTTSPPRIEWSRDGKKLYASERTAASPQQRIVEIDLGSGERRVLTQPGATLLKGEPGDDEATLSPDGNWIAFRRMTLAAAGEVFVIPVRGGQARQVTQDHSGIIGLAWARDGHSLIVSSRRSSSLPRLWRFLIEGKAEPVCLTDASLGASHPAVSPDDGTIAYASLYHDSNIWRLDLKEGSAPQRIIASNLLDSSAAYSSDGSRIAFRSNRTGNDEIWITDANGRSPARITDFGGPVTGSAHWSPDGQYLVFDSRPSGNADIFLVPAGGGSVRQLTRETSNEIIPSFSRDGKHIYYASNRTGVWQIWKQPLDGGAPRQITRNGGFAARESPDGRWLYYSKPNMAGLFRAPLDGGDEMRVLSTLPEEFWGAWTLAGDRVLFFAPPRDKMADAGELRMLDPTTGETWVVATTRYPPVSWDGAITVSPDGRFALVSLLEREGSEIHLLPEQ